MVPPPAANGLGDDLRACISRTLSKGDFGQIELFLQTTHPEAFGRKEAVKSDEGGMVEETQPAFRPDHPGEAWEKHDPTAEPLATDRESPFQINEPFEALDDEFSNESPGEGMEVEFEIGQIVSPPNDRAERDFETP